MKKNRYLLCLLATGVMLYYGIPELAPYDQGAAGVFSVSWLLLAVIVIAGNLSGILYEPKKRRAIDLQPLKQEKKQRVRSY